MNCWLDKHSRLRSTGILGAFFACICLWLSFGLASATAAAKEPGPVISLVVDGRGVESDVLPLVRNGRMLVPIRVIAEATGAQIEYDAKKQRVTFDQKGKHVSLDINSRLAYVNGERVTLETPPIIVNQRTLVPLRFVSESLGYQVEWDATSSVAFVQTKPVEDRAVTVKESANPYVVQPNDTLGEIAERHGTTRSAIRENNYLSSEKLMIGQILFLPHEAKKAEHPLASKVQDKRLLSKDYWFPFNNASWYEPYGDSFGSDREWTESQSGSVRSHEGIDIMAPKGTPIYSVSDGTINRVGWNTYGGWRINITDKNGQFRMYYAHLSAYAPGLRVGGTVKAGQLIGFVGDTGYGGPGTVGMFAPHLHFGMYRNDNGRVVDPFDYLRYWEQNKVVSLFA
ncbi:LysM peptidoglycan-binding domain-containing protein [Brevibacillus gelatini]|uniref:LysM peptidoglycan-binding domain-containing protein n=1 Tax=Brevibacillus gelatini TaxID=1655277 RepID=A0A3M8BAC4_9BACL|nr:stalk domain-containing protein [Brevibacillus gelatini]RNB59775.1 LysM peptidoglycan-binding domain-containing protein [Brevibacillus gelatini]